MATSLARKPKSDTPIQKFRRLVWNKLLEWEFLEELCSEVQFGEVRILVHEGEVRDLFIDLHIRKDK